MNDFTQLVFSVLCAVSIAWMICLGLAVENIAIQLERIASHLTKEKK